MTFQNRDGRSVVAATQNAAFFPPPIRWDGSDNDEGSGEMA